MELYNHQKEIVELNPDRHALVWSTGTGKTYGFLGIAQKRQLPFIVICPKGLVDKWNAQIKTFGIDHLDHIVISKEQFKIRSRDLGVYPVVCVDEAHYFFGTTSALMKSLRWYLEKHDVRYRYLLTGTPYRSTPMDIYIMCALLGRKLHYYDFQNRFFYQVRMGSRTIPMVKKDIEPEIAKIVASVGSIVKLEDCVDMPAAIFDGEVVAPTKGQMEAIIALEGTLPVTRYTAEHQIAGGTLKGSEYEPTTYYESNKLKALKDRVAGIDRTIVVCRYNNEIDFLAEELKSTGKRIEKITGAVTEREELLASLNGEERYVLIVNAKISEGWELTSCSHMVFYSYDFELKNYVQMMGRLRRINEPRPAMYITLAVKDTVDEAVYASLKNKEDFHIAIYAREKGVV